jgi:hypothetical protein
VEGIASQQSRTEAALEQLADKIDDVEDMLSDVLKPRSTKHSVKAAE